MPQTIIPSQVDVTDLDQESLESRLFELIASVFPEWTDSQRAGFGNILLGLFAFVGDVLTYYLNRQGDESRFATAQLRSSMLSLVKLINYDPLGASASQADVDITVTNDPRPVGDISIPAGTVIRSTSALVPVRFQTLVTAQISDGDTSISLTAENSVGQLDQYESTLLDNQSITLSAVPYLDNSSVIVAGNGSYIQVTDFHSSGSDSREFTVAVDEFDTATITFGDGVNGEIPTGTITVSYRTGGGSSGVVDALTLDRIDGAFVTEFGTSVTLSVSNPAGSTTARDRETVDEIRINAPLSLRVLNRTVAREDYELGAVDSGRALRALMQTSNEDVGISENRGILYVVGLGGADPTQDDLDTIATYFIDTKPKTLTFGLDVLAAPFVDTVVSTVVWLEDGANQATVTAQIQDNLDAYFDPTPSGTRASEGLRQVDFGYYLEIETGDSAIPLSDIHEEIARVEGVRKIDDRPDGILINGVREDLVISGNQFPRLSSVTVLFLNP
jgi:hypothetical protein